MNLTQLSSSVSRSGGGVTEVMKCLSHILSQSKQVSLQVVGLKDEQTDNDADTWTPLKPIATKVIGPAAIGFSPSLIPTLKSFNTDLIHLHGLWQYTSYAMLKSGVPFMTSIHGMLEPWAINNSNFKKRIAGFLYENQALKKARCLHAITLQEYQDIRNFGLTNPVCIIPNGVFQPKNISELKSEKPIWSHLVGPESKVLLYLGRIHPKKGLTNLIDAWSKKTMNGEDWRLVIAGWNQGDYESELKKQTEKLGLNKTIHFLGPQFGRQKELAFAHADGFILPSFSEGLPMVVLEAWAYGVPVLMTPHCNLPEGIEAGANIMMEPNIDSIANGLNQFFSLSNQQRIEMGLNGKSLVAEKFDWGMIGKQMLEVYDWIVNKGEQPKTVKLN